MIRTGWLTFLLAVTACGTTDNTDADTDSDVVVDTDDTAEVDTADTDVAIDTDTDFTIETDTGFDTDLDTDTDLPPCPTDWVRDCSNQCSAQSLIGNDFCEEGPGTKPHFNCEEFGFDGGDCLEDTDTDAVVCPFPGEVPDCDGVCTNPGPLLGDDDCNDGTFGANLNCASFNFDDGDCEPDTDPTDLPVDTDLDTDVFGVPCPGLLDVRDCQGTCYYEGWLGDGTCDDGTPGPFGSPDFDCAFRNFDGGDCSVVADTDTDGVPDTDTDVLP